MCFVYMYIVVYSTVHSREIMDSSIMAKYCRCISGQVLIKYSLGATYMIQ